jgi:hypothetical protein
MGSGEVQPWALKQSTASAVPEEVPLSGIIQPFKLLITIKYFIFRTRCYPNIKRFE